MSASTAGMALEMPGRDHLPDSGIFPELGRKPERKVLEDGKWTG